MQSSDPHILGLQAIHKDDVPYHNKEIPGSILVLKAHFRNWIFLWIFFVHSGKQWQILEKITTVYVFLKS
jgi:hypothetical protein